MNCVIIGTKFLFLGLIIVYLENMYVMDCFCMCVKMVRFLSVFAISQWNACDARHTLIMFIQ